MTVSTAPVAEDDGVRVTRTPDEAVSITVAVTGEADDEAVEVELDMEEEAVPARCVRGSATFVVVEPKGKNWPEEVIDTTEELLWTAVELAEDEAPDGDDGGDADDDAATAPKD